MSVAMTDLEMTKLCAEVMEYVCAVMSPRYIGSSVLCFKDNASIQFNPLDDDAQAMALVKKLGLTIDPQEDEPPFTWRVVVALNGDWDNQIYSEGSDLNRAIMECVAKIQKAKAPR